MLRASGQGEALFAELIYSGCESRYDGGKFQKIKSHFATASAQWARSSLSRRGAISDNLHSAQLTLLGQRPRRLRTRIIFEVSQQALAENAVLKSQDT